MLNSFEARTESYLHNEDGLLTDDMVEPAQQQLEEVLGRLDKLVENLEVSQGQLGKLVLKMTEYGVSSCHDKV